MGTEKQAFRKEKDSLGEIQVPLDALYGAQTQRAIENFPISGRKPDWAFIWPIVWIKLCAAEVHRDLGLLPVAKANAIIVASREILEGKYRDQFVVDWYQAGAGTSHHMNVNEVIANCATVILGGKPGDYLVHPNDDVNMAQSTNDVIPTAIRLGCLYLLPALNQVLDNLIQSLNRKSTQFSRIRKSGRTHLQDAAPIFLGDEFHAYATALGRDKTRIQHAAGGLSRLGIGGTAVGSGMNAHPEYRERILRLLREYTRIDVHGSDDLFESMQSMADFVDFSAALRTLAVTSAKIANDIRLLSSGPNTGLDEIHFPAVQPGSSIMPGKINPVIAEMVNMVMYQVIGYDTTVMMAGQAGQLELNVMMPVIASNLFEMMNILTNSLRIFSERCVDGITANEKQIRAWLEQNPILITALNPIIGYEAGARLVKQALETGQPLLDLLSTLVREEKLRHQNTGTPVTLEELNELVGKFLN